MLLGTEDFYKEKKYSKGNVSYKKSTSKSTS